ncbi:membrane protein insertase YidC [Aggregatibacter actinomycetemcomitans]|uniref:Membrane protein insertase YidC n=4 Tax=Aggregatibacter actinomycetemcomitans TaxID=714 RepID=A0A5D0ENR0_AGGAC|nr:membrane protein insertase YidC [Aggregatibacter actinomycetemcomitans]AFI87682.2 membrane protein insertase [Aggregatibacter actinomycetemcomitans D7S-1]AMQ93576.1 insertase [Aggregatibacter actinomycetemcomitans]ANU83139.1 membrane protein insertase YidC [Aggregatibacter actinomycetemcomitans]EKX93986.1 membrane protein insertase, YidC/Oxa1 family domain protein [Aggregatibacter actinomycetemcomitans Y4]KOE66925.1 membrane protein insertase [Aggregatibacter actinomycetemcomitans serotype 
MDSRRGLLVIALLFMSFIVYQQWQLDYHTPKPVTTEQTAASASDVPASSNVGNAVIATDTQAKGKIITLENDVFRLKINTLGGDVVSSELLKYDAELDSNTPFMLLQNTPQHVYIAQSGLIGKNGIDTKSGRADYQADGDNFKLADGQNELSVPLVYVKDGVTYRKVFTLKRGEYNIAVNYEINNQSDKTIEVEPYGQLRHTLVESSGNVAMPTYTGGAYSSSETNYKKYSFSDMENANLSINTKAGWVAVLQHYFVSAWIPNQDADNQLYTLIDKANNIGSIGYRGPVTSIQPNTTETLTSKLWTGPKLQNEMAQVANHLDLTVDYGWAWFIAKPLFRLLTFIQKLVHNWGVAIICVTLVVKAILYPLTKAQYTSMAKMRMLQPKLQEMRERFGEDRQRMSQEMMKLYKDEKVNPLGGCLPLLLQMPIFIALYWTFLEAVELRHAPFFGWIQDLSAQDPYYILPILMGGSMFLLQKMSPTPVADPIQQKVMTFMPLIFMVFFLWFPAGLVLYWLVSNLITIIQQQLIYRGLEKKGLHTRHKK